MLPVVMAAAFLTACSGSDSTNASGSGTAGAGGTGVGGGAGAVRPGSQEDLAANIGDRVFFDTDRSTLQGSSQLAQGNIATLDRQVAWLKQFPQNMIEVAGNCDERGTTEYNLALGERRAYAVQNYMVARGVAQSRITTISYGKERPTVPGSTPEAWAQNRNAITSVR
jgi:peptidoglycan-associated lipoprotein